MLLSELMWKKIRKERRHETSFQNLVSDRDHDFWGIVTGVCYLRLVYDEPGSFHQHGNRENRPQNIPGYVEGSFHGGNILYEPQYPNLLFAVDGEVYRFAGTDCLVVGGAYSTGKEYRLVKGLGWWPDEQPSDETKRQVEALLARRGWQMPVVLTHTCPLRYKPLEALKPDLDQSTVDCTTELWMDAIESRLRYDHWFCGHFHTDKQIDNLQILFQTFVPFPSEG